MNTKNELLKNKNNDFESLLCHHSTDVIELFNKLSKIIKDSIKVELEEKIWAKMPSFYYEDRFVRLIPFKKHINIEAKAIKNNLKKLSNYIITPTGMLKIEVNQEIPVEVLTNIFQETLYRTQPISIKDQLNQDKYLEWIVDDKDFIVQFNEKMNELGYTCNNEIVDGICYGKYMMIYRKQSVKSDKVYARIYFRTNGIVLRLFLNNIDKHSNYINNSPSFIKEAFVGDYATCNHCHGDVCKFRKTYSINHIQYEKCNGLTFEFAQPTLERLKAYLELFLEFYPQ